MGAILSKRLAAAAMICLAAYPAQAQSPQPVRPSPVSVMLVKNTLTAVNHANITGNYTVVRDLGCPTFREKHSAAQLSMIFQKLRDQKTDLSPILVLEPEFTLPPSINDAGQLQMAGFFATTPLQVQFRLAFQRVPGGWMIDEISISTPSTTPPPTQDPNVGASASAYRQPQPVAGPVDPRSATQPQYSR
jgi:hypothetical protein